MWVLEEFPRMLTEPHLQKPNKEKKRRGDSVTLGGAVSSMCR